jgi:hypothetical protein
MLPHKIFEEAKFYEECKNLKNRFSTSASNTLFPNTGESKNVPIDGLPVFIDKTWDKIKSQKELNLPDQRIMVANLRCNELKEESLEKVNPELNKLRVDSDKGYVEGFADACREIIKIAISYYDEYAH